jgi:hypothetical protein
MTEKDERVDERPATVRLAFGLYEKVARVAVEENRSVSGQIRHFVEQGLQARERVAV